MRFRGFKSKLRTLRWEPLEALAIARRRSRHITIAHGRAQMIASGKNPPTWPDSPLTDFSAEAKRANADIAQGPQRVSRLLWHRRRQPGWGTTASDPSVDDDAGGTEQSKPAAITEPLDY